MAKFQYMILSRSKPGSEEDYVRWYGEQHLADVCRVPGVLGGRLHRMDWQKVYDLDAPQWTLMAVYEIESDDPQSVLDAILARAGSDSMPFTDTLEKAGMIQAVGHLIASA